MNSPTNFGDMFRLWLASERITMDDIAKELEVSKATICRICAGNQPDAKTLIKLITWLFK